MNRTETAVFGGGCFWCIEAIFKMLRGVNSVMPGYAGGTVVNPTYEDVCTGKTGHAEVVKIDFDPSIIPYHDLLEIFFHLHDPTSLNRQGNDVGTQYRSIIFYTSEAQKNAAERMMKSFTSNIVTEIKPFRKFYEAEHYHHDYYAKNSYQPYCQVVISPKLQHLRELYSNKLK